MYFAQNMKRERTVDSTQFQTMKPITVVVQTFVLLTMHPNLIQTAVSILSLPQISKTKIVTHLVVRNKHGFARARPQQ